MSESITEFKGKYRFLSNFYRSNTFVVCAYHGTSYSVMFPTNEHWFVAMKAGNDLSAILSQRGYTHKEFMDLTPGQVKRMGRTIQLRIDWEEVKSDVMLRGLRAKFYAGSTLAKLLMETGDRTIIEENAWEDIYWGVSKETGEGQNVLGQLLMQVRAELKNQAT
jgi:ribA/ribD-fused uncharacterized protein